MMMMMMIIIIIIIMMMMMMTMMIIKEVKKRRKNERRKIRKVFGVKSYRQFPTIQNVSAFYSGLVINPDFIYT